jgi:endo-1,4-beta-xylanase
LANALQAHITGGVTQYKGKCYAWDIVNEALNADGTFGSDIFFDTLGQDYIQIAFEVETAGAKSTTAQGIVKTLQVAGVSIDGVGFQSHFIVRSTPSTAAQVSNLEGIYCFGC